MFSSVFHPLCVVIGISKINFPFPEKLGFHFLTSITLVDFIFLSSQIALNGLQKKECIDKFFSFLKIKSNGKDFFLNINPLNFLKGVSQTSTSTLIFFPSIK